MWIPIEPSVVAFGPATPPTGAISALANLSTNYGGPRLMETDTVQNFPFGYRVRGYDPIHGFGEFIYLQGVASTVAGDLVTYNPLTGVTTRGAATANDSSPIAFALAPCVASLFGWYQIAGVALANNNATAAVGNAFTKATAQIGSAAVAGTQILGGAKILVANGTTFTKTGTTRNGSTEVFFSNLDGVYVGMAISGTGIPGGTTVAAGYNNSPNARNSSAGSAASLVMSAAATADGTVTVTFTRTNQSLLGGQFYFGQGQIT
jgi:hypothetical protein